MRGDGDDGDGLVREIRSLADETLTGVPVVAATAFGRTHSREAAVAAAFTERLTNPVDPEVLCVAIGRVLGR